MKITEQTIIGDLLGNDIFQPILQKYNVPCMVCPYAQSELGLLTLGGVADAYHLNLEDLLEDLNQAAKDIEKAKK